MSLVDTLENQFGPNTQKLKLIIAMKLQLDLELKLQLEQKLEHVKFMNHTIIFRLYYRDDVYSSITTLAYVYYANYTLLYMF